jgi:hypothetical protein
MRKIVILCLERAMIVNFAAIALQEMNYAAQQSCEVSHISRWLATSRLAGNGSKWQK